MSIENRIVVAAEHAIDGVLFKVGRVIGKMTDKGPVSTHEQVTRGHIEARLRNKKVIVGDPRQFAPDQGREDGDAIDYAMLTAKELLARVNERRQTGRDVQPASQKKTDLVAALETDDEQQALAAPDRKN